MVEVPARGTFIWLYFGEQMGRRPALVVSHTAFNCKRGFAFVCPISNTRRKNPFYVAIPAGLAVTGIIMCDQLRLLDYRIRNAEFLGECPIFILEEVLLRIQPIFL